jgi:hypothetical protein
MKSNKKKLNSSFILIICLSLLLLSCSKEDSVTNPDVINPPNPVTPGEVKLTSYTPQKPMWGDVITIVGEGFGNSKQNVEVYFPGNYVPITDTIKSKGEVLEVSNTQIKVKIPYNTEIGSDGYEYPLGIHNGWGNIVIKVKDKSTYTSPDYFIYYNAVPFINKSGIDPLGISGVYIVPGEKFKISGKGFGLTKTEGTLTINSNSVNIDSVWYNVAAFGEGSWNMIGKLPASLGSKSKELKDYTFAYSRSGRSYSRTTTGESLPRLKINSNTLPGQVLGGTSNTDFYINGENLFANTIRFSDGVFTTTVAVTGPSLDATQVTAFVPLAVLLPRGDKLYTVTLLDTDVGSQVIGGWLLGYVRVTP